MDILAEGLNMLATTRDAEMASPAVYRRVNGQTVTINVTPARTDWQEENTSGVVTARRSHDFITLTESLAIAGVKFEPATGDEVIVSRAGRTYTYRVIPGSGVPCFEYTSEQRYSVRIRTLLKGVV